MIFTGKVYDRMENRRRRASSGPKMTGMKQKKKKKARRRPLTRRGRTIQLLVRLFIFVAVTATLVFGGRELVPVIIERITEPQKLEDHSLYSVPRPDMDINLLEAGSAARPSTSMEDVTGIVIHYADTRATDAAQVRENYAAIINPGKDDAGSHFVIGTDGQILQCIPCNEESCASGNRNNDTISITCCANIETEKVGDEEYKSLVQLTAWLVLRYDLQVDDILRHSDIDSTDCPAYYEENKGKWRQFKTDVYTYICANAIETATETETAAESETATETETATEAGTED